MVLKGFAVARVIGGVSSVPRVTVDDARRAIEIDATIELRRSVRGVCRAKSTCQANREREVARRSTHSNAHLVWIESHSVHTSVTCGQVDEAITYQVDQAAYAEACNGCEIAGGGFLIDSPVSRECSMMVRGDHCRHL